MKTLIYIIILIFAGCENNPNSTEDCNGVEFGLSILDNCGICDDDPTNDCEQDCLGIWGGTAIYDECGECGGDGKLDCQNNCIYPNENGNYTASGVDCMGICGGSAIIDECFVCNGPGSVYECGCNGIEEGKCDCNGNIIGCDNICGSGLSNDCNGECNGEAVFDECEVCDGTGPEENQDCDGNCIAGFDDCGICGGDNSSCNSNNFNPCDMQINEIYILDGAVYYYVNFDIKGFQFNIEGATTSGSSGGDSVEYGFTVSAAGSTVLGFSFTGSSIPADCGILTLLDLDGTPTGLSNIIFDDGSDDTSNEVNYHQP